MRSKKDHQIQLHLCPQYGGILTRLLLYGSVVSHIPHAEFHLLLERLAFWSGWPVKLVLPADSEAALWSDWWTDALWEAPELHHELRLVAGRQRQRGSREQA